MQLFVRAAAGAFVDLLCTRNQPAALLTALPAGCAGYAWVTEADALAILLGSLGWQLGHPHPASLQGRAGGSALMPVRPCQAPAPLLHLMAAARLLALCRMRRRRLRMNSTRRCVWRLAHGIPWGLACAVACPQIGATCSSARPHPDVAGVGKPCHARRVIPCRSHPDRCISMHANRNAHANCAGRPCFLRPLMRLSTCACVLTLAKKVLLQTGGGVAGARDLQICTAETTTAGRLASNAASSSRSCGSGAGQGVSC